jgi:hypothetical protein
MALSLCCLALCRLPVPVRVAQRESVERLDGAESFERDRHAPIVAPGSYIFVLT